MEGWKSKWLSLAGRLLMLKSVVSAMSIFPMAYFKLLVSIIKNMQQKMRKFMWNGNEEHDKILLMAWDRVCKPKGGRGTSLCEWKLINEAMGLSWCGKCTVNQSRGGSKFYKLIYLDSREKERILTVENPPRGFALWNFLEKGVALAGFLAWASIFGVLGPPRWNWKDPREINLGSEEERYLRKILENREVSFSREEAEIFWCGTKSGSDSVKVGVSLLESEGRMKEWEAKLAGNRQILSGDCLRKMGFTGPFCCVFCEKVEEDVDHLLLNCEFAQDAWLFGLQRLN
ncbi:uncharacterized protein LOC131054599 [Cryptomeria japonica]|uniref:uncharacterized protein LOC131054599 n=1 Tax=Cryptomeria japonica TaxID=3369 RepID=UPI0027D9E65B|nr:uncharacterized protein LOC131054599 [Cryptomeria japonica]